MAIFPVLTALLVHVPNCIRRAPVGRISVTPFSSASPRYDEVFFLAQKACLSILWPLRKFLAAPPESWHVFVQHRLYGKIAENRLSIPALRFVTFPSQPFPWKIRHNNI
jgi:hypothetical protein